MSMTFFRFYLMAGIATLALLAVPCAHAGDIASEKLLFGTGTRMLDEKPLPRVSDPMPTLKRTPVAEIVKSPTGSQTYKQIQLIDALSWAYENNPELRAARSGLEASREQIPQALSDWQPDITAESDVTALDTNGSNFGGSGTTSKGMEINFTQPVFRGGRTIAGTDKARSSVRAALALLNAKEQDVMYRAGAAYMDVLRDQSVLELQEKNKAVIARELESTKIRFEAGELTRTDVAQAEARLAAAESARVRALGNLMSGKAMYEEIVGRPAEKLTAPPPGFLSLPESAEQSVEAAERANPELEAAEHLHKSTKQQAREILGELLPELGLFGSWNRQYDPQPGLLKDSTDKTIGIRASMPLFRGGANASRVREARHEANEKYMEIMQARRRVHQEAVTAWETLRAARSEKQARASQVKASEIAREGVHQETDLGARTVLDALDADRELLDARVALITAERDEIIAALDLARITGMLTPSGLGFRETSDVSRHAGTPSGWPLTGFGVDIMGETD